MIYLYAIQVMWDDIIGEPEGLRSIDCAWNCSYKCFKGTKNCCYILLTVFFAPCLAFCSAINFACLAFQVILGRFDYYIIIKNIAYMHYMMNNQSNTLLAHLVYGALSSHMENKLCLFSSMLRGRLSWMLWSLCRVLRTLLC